MPRRQLQNLPRIWLMTDERLGDRLRNAIDALPLGSGIVFRHYSLAEPSRRVLYGQVRRYARKRRQVIAIAGKSYPGCAGRHGHFAQPVRGLKTMPVHNLRERIAAERAGADLIFVSPVFATRSHPGAKPLGRVRFGLLVRGSRCPVIALGGMTARKARSLRSFGIHGWAAIDAFAA